MPRLFGEGDQDAGETIEQDRPRGAEQPTEAGAENPPEGFAKHPDAQAPSDAGHPGQARPVPACGGEQPEPDPDLDPHRCGCRCHRVVAPNRRTRVDQVLHPTGRTGGCRLDNLGGQAQWHRDLGLQDSVEHPDKPE